MCKNSPMYDSPNDSPNRLPKPQEHQASSIIKDGVREPTPAHTPVDPIFVLTNVMYHKQLGNWKFYVWLEQVFIIFEHLVLVAVEISLKFKKQVFAVVM